MVLLPVPPFSRDKGNRFHNLIPLYRLTHLRVLVYNNRIGERQEKAEG